MANPQLENGHIRIANEIAEALMKTNLSSYQSRILWAIWRKTWGWRKKEDWISISQLCRMTGIHKANASRTKKELLERNMIVINSDNKIMFNKNWETWKLSNQITQKKGKKVINPDNAVIDSDNKSLSDQTYTKEKKTTYTKEKVEHPRQLSNQITKEKTEHPKWKFKKNVPLPEKMYLTPAMIQYAKNKGIHNEATIRDEFEAFCINHRKRGTKWKDWDAAWQYWVRKALEINPGINKPVRVECPRCYQQFSTKEIKAGCCPACGYQLQKT